MMYFHLATGLILSTLGMMSTPSSSPLIAAMPVAPAPATPLSSRNFGAPSSHGQILAPAPNATLTVGQPFNFTYSTWNNTMAGVPYDATQYVHVSLVTYGGRAPHGADEPKSSYNLTSYLAPSPSGGDLSVFFYIPQDALPANSTETRFFTYVSRPTRTYLFNHRKLKLNIRRRSFFQLETAEYQVGTSTWNLDGSPYLSSVEVQLAH
ncbi:BQ2448_398 [Microbotryum intermedium]|uniref:BQ2448_398 protein n=1 Tax=Microbotryum intermedium TaxID=269621 RepID=A0A238F5H6_9BASI|nr:BQ2448_398 [Microbotryum intermedium]